MGGGWREGRSAADVDPPAAVRVYKSLLEMHTTINQVF